MESIELSPRGQGLRRPECVLATPGGDLYVSDWRGGVTAIRTDGSQQSWLAKDAPIELKPNGIAFDTDGNFLIANLGEAGGIWRLDVSGHVEPIAKHLCGAPFPPANFVWLDDEDRIWATVSTLREPRQLAWKPDVADGLVVLIDRQGTRVVAEGMHYTNEARVDPSGEWLYVVETFGQRLVRFALRGDGLGKSELVAKFGPGFFPDGFAFDAEGGIWVTSLVSNTILRIDKAGRQHTVLAERNDEHIAVFQEKFDTGTLAPDALGPIPGTRLQHTTSLAFGGPDGKRLAIGCLHNDCVFEMQVDVAGAPLRHWDQPLP